MYQTYDYCNNCKRMLSKLFIMNLEISNFQYILKILDRNL